MVSTGVSGKPTGNVEIKIDAGDEKSSPSLKDKVVNGDIESLIRKEFGKDADVAVAIAKAESGLKSDNVGDKHLARPSIGLFQISLLYHDYDENSLKNPEYNIRVAKQIFDRGGWNRWTTYRTGAYLQYLQ